MLKFLVRFDAIIALSGVHVPLILGYLLTQLKYAVLLVKEHVVIVLDLDLSNLLCHSLVILLHLVALRVGESLELLELLVPYRNIRRR
jgi:hypothetical protein